MKQKIESEVEVPEFYCPQCSAGTEELHEGYCRECCDENQQRLDDHNAHWDQWNKQSDEERSRICRLEAPNEV